MIVILIFVIALVAWSLHLMQAAIEQKEFSLMLAGFLVATAAAAMVAVYFLMGSYVGYVTEMAQRPGSFEGSSDSWVRVSQIDDWESTWLDDLTSDSDLSQVTSSVSTYQF